jgi:hypothetical protein
MKPKTIPAKSAQTVNQSRQWRCFGTNGAVSLLDIMTVTSTRKSLLIE